MILIPHPGNNLYLIVCVTINTGVTIQSLLWEIYHDSSLHNVVLVVDPTTSLEHLTQYDDETGMLFGVKQTHLGSERTAHLVDPVLEKQPIAWCAGYTPPEMF
ncbi:uncharacterized protein PHALS_03130 [Plasmopara halstedii]|uniref:Uncharacterized protein n=1 Tax=Plasmopara halstedii TaxID=4781 RepID=A0A0P1A8A9_PLAHL|nr:uncharacterized protein PHALS_03130 [Plasmopara halstedii]CEG36585.1 hypothetical protein PHALS_03130 [Plasmopara halstedii]|eukprot:XP_024572954.1 hypothetical protein PHALS_03130 [Plasmopara halstedii]